MGVKDKITVMFNGSIFRENGKIELINMESGAIEKFDINDSTKVEIDGTKLSLQPEKALISDKNYTVRIPADGTLKDSEGQGYGGLIIINSKRKLISLSSLLVMMILVFMTVESFDPRLKRRMSFLNSLSAGQISYKIYRLNNII